jgi:hypothetical protein
MISYVGDRLGHDSQAVPVELLGEAFLLYVTPQLDGLDRQSVLSVYGHLRDEVFTATAILDSLLRRIRSLYPHVGRDDWDAPSL